MYVPKSFKLVKSKDKGRSLLSSRDFAKGENLLKLKGDIVSFNDLPPRDHEYVLQIDDDKFLNSKHFFVEDFINHSCDPNVMVDLNGFFFVALRDIKKGEEITYNYMTTEYDLVRDSQDFDCRCGSKDCYGRIKGFRFLSQEQKLKISHLLAPYLKKKL